MQIKVGDVLTLSDKKEYVVVSIAELDLINYYYIADINDESNLKICYLDKEELVEIKDSDLIIQLLPLFKENIES